MSQRVTLVGGGGGGGFEVSETEYPSNSWLSELEVTMSGSPGYLTLEYAAEGKSVDEMAEGGNIVTDIGEEIAEFIGDSGGFVDNWDVNISFTPFGLGEIRNQVNSELNDVAANIGMSVAALTQGASGLSSGFGGSGFEINPFSESITVPVGGWGSGEKFFSFDPISIPVPEGYSVIERLKERDSPLAEISVTFGYSGFTSISWDRNQTTVTVEVPPEAFIIETELSGDCFNLYPDIATPLQQMPSRVQSRLSGAQDARSQLQDMADELGSGANVDIPDSIPQAVNNIQDISPQDLIGGDFATLKTNIETTDTRFNQANEMRDTLESLRDEVGSNVGETCSPDFMNDIDAIDSELTRLENISSEAQNLKGAMLDVLEGVESIDCGSAFSSIDSRLDNIGSNIGLDTGASPSQLSLSGDQLDNLLSDVNDAQSDIEDEVPSGSPCRTQFLSRTDDMRSRIQQLQQDVISDLGCGDISNSIRSQVNSIESSEQTFTAQDQLARLPERKEELLSEIDDVISNVQNNVDDRNPCKSQYLSRLRQARSELQAAGVRPQSAVPCEQRFEGIGNQLDEFEDQVLDLTPPIRPEDVQDIANRGEELANTIDSEIPSDDTCRSEMTERVRSLVDRTRTLTPQLRIETEGEQADEQRRQELIDQLLGSIDTLENVSGGDVSGDAEEAVEEAVGDTNIPST